MGGVIIKLRKGDFMKKIITILTAIILLFCISISVCAVNYSGNTTSAWINNEFQSMLLNEYFRNNYNSLLEYNYNIIKNNPQTEVRLDNISPDGLNVADGYYVMIVFDETHKSEVQGYIDFNMLMTTTISDKIKEVTYTGSTTPCIIALIAPDKSTADAISKNENVKGVYDAFCHEYTNVAWEVDYEPHKEKITAADARKVLRVSAGLEKPVANQKAFYCFFDFNSNNKIDAADARLVLRCAAGLETPRSFESACISYWLTDNSYGLRGF